MKQTFATDKEVSVPTDSGTARHTNPRPDERVGYTRLVEEDSEARFFSENTPNAKGHERNATEGDVETPRRRRVSTNLDQRVSANHHRTTTTYRPQYGVSSVVTLTLLPPAWCSPVRGGVR